MDNPWISDEVFQRMVTMRRDLHRHPELSWEEARTADRIAEALDRMGIVYRRVARTGIIADLPGELEVPAVALRADTDALPVHEQTGLDFSSVHEGVMHACGHDGHTSMVLGAAEVLAREPRKVPIRLLWQPAEEKGAGAPAMIQAGALDGVGMIFGGHLDRHYPPGTLVVTEGPVNASTDTFTIEISGQSGHGARPHESIDAIVVGSLLVTALQTIVSREIDPARPSVVSVGSFHAGRASNVIAGRATLSGTIRSQHAEVRAQLCRAIPRIAAAIGQLHGAKMKVDVQSGTPPVTNSAEMAALSRQAAIAVVGEDQVLPLKTANMGGEDFAYYLERVRGSYIRYGSAVEGREGFPAHSSQWDFHEDALALGAAYLVEMARRASQQILREAGHGSP